MGVHDHHQQAGSAPVTFEIVVVSTSRTDATDEAGPAIADRLGRQGHLVRGVHRVPDDPALLGDLLVRLLGTDVQCVLLTGGTGISARDCTVDVVRPHLTRELPGFGEIFRRLSFDEIGPAAFLSRALGGLAGDTMVFCLPGSPAACGLALDRLLLPEIRHLAWEVRREHADAPPVQAPLHVEVAEPTVPTSDAPASPPPPWRQALIRADATLEEGTWEEIPPGMASLSALRNVLEGAGQRARVRFPGGGTGAVLGFPDLSRPSSKVLLVAEGEPYGLLVALHRQPRPAGVAIRGDATWVPDVAADPVSVAEQVTGLPAPVEGTLFAVEGGLVYLLVGRRVTSWDGRRQRDEGTPESVMASLALRWSQR